MAAVDGAIRVDGLAQFARDLRKIDGELPKALRKGGNRAAQLVVDGARPKIPTRSGAARRSLRTASTRTAVRVRGGGGRVPYFPWLDYGGKVGPDRSVSRPFRKEGRYVYPTYYAVRDQVVTVLADELRQVAASAGWDVD